MEPTTLTPGQQVEIRRFVTLEDKATHPFHDVPFRVPAGTTRLDIEVRYDKADNCVLDFGIMDSRATSYPSRSGFRGWSGGAREKFFLATDAASPGYYAGPMPDGVWNLLLGLYRVPPEGVEVVWTLKADNGPRDIIQPEAPSEAVWDQPGWYRGDLHCHTYHSDAKGAPELLARNARLQGLDFLAVTDHNTTSQWEYFGPQSSKELVFVPGMEVTTYRGHANVFGLTEWIDFRLGGSHDLDALLAEVRRQGGLFSVNHDKSPLPWEYDYPGMDCMEVFHRHWLTDNAGVLARYDSFLAEGRRISLIGGSDYHQPAELQPPGPFSLGRPTTVVWLPRLDRGAVLDGLRSGHAYVTESPAGPHLAFTVNGHPMGSLVETDGTIEVEVEADGAEGDRLVLVSEKGVVAETPIESGMWKKTLSFPAPRTFLRAEIVADTSRQRLIRELLDWYEGQTEFDRSQQPLEEPPAIRRALSNPVYFGRS